MNLPLRATWCRLLREGAFLTAPRKLDGQFERPLAMDSKQLQAALLKFAAHPKASTHPELRRFWDIHGVILGTNRQALLTQLTLESGQLGKAARSLAEESLLGAVLESLGPALARPGLLKILGLHAGATRLHRLQDGNLLTFAPQGEARLWNKGGVIRRWALREVKPFLIKSLGNDILVLSQDGRCRFWNTAQSENPTQLKLPGNCLPQMWKKARLIPGGKIVYADFHTTYLVDLQTGQTEQQWNWSGIHFAALPAGNRIASLGGPSLCLLDVNRGDFFEEKLEHSPEALLAISDGSVLLACEEVVEQWQPTENHWVRLRVLTHQPLSRREQNSGLRHPKIKVLAQDHCANYFWSADVQGGVSRWDLRAGKCALRLETGLTKIATLELPPRPRSWWTRFLPGKAAESEIAVAALASDGNLAAVRAGQLTAHRLPSQALLSAQVLDLAAGRVFCIEGGCLEEWELQGPQAVQAAPLQYEQALAFSASGEELLTYRNLRLIRGGTSLGQTGERATLANHSRGLAWAAEDGLHFRDWSRHKPPNLWSYQGERPSTYNLPRLSFDLQDRLWALQQGTEGPDRLSCYDPRSGGEVCAQIEHEPSPADCQFACHRHFPIAVSSGPYQLTLWDLRNGSARTMDRVENIARVALHPVEPILAVLYHQENLGPKLVCYDLNSWTPISEEIHLGQSYTGGLEFFDPEHLGYIDGEVNLKVCRWRSPCLLGPIWTAAQPICGLVGSPSGRVALNGSRELWLMKWNPGHL